MTGWRPNRRATLMGLAVLPAARAPSPRADADRYLRVVPRTITAFPAPRSPGGRHDYYSEADYWWPDLANPTGRYVRRDGRSNPGRFDRHRDAMIELSLAVPALVAAWRETGDRRYARHAARFLDAWFVDPATAMAPDLRYAQRIIGVDTGRAIGIIDTVHLVEVARAAQLLAEAGALPHAAAVRGWFARYLGWLTVSARGHEERDQRNNHGTCWALQAAAFARLTGDAATVAFCAERFRTRLIPDQVAPDGAQPLELARTKPYAYSLFNLDALAALAHLASTRGDDLWRFRTADGRSLAGALAFMAPFIRDRARWPYARDVEYFDQWPVRSVALLFGGRALGEERYLTLWRALPPIPAVREVIRNVPLRQPVLWD